MSDSKKKIYLGSDLVCQTFTDAEEQAKAFDLFGLEQPIVSSNAPASTRPVQQGQVCEFDGVDDYVSLPSNAVMQDGQSFTWVIRAEQTGGNDIELSRKLPYRLFIRQSYINNLRYYDGVNLHIFGSSSVLYDGSYHTLVITRTGTSYEAFIDAVSIGSITTAVGFIINQIGHTNFKGMIHSVTYDSYGQYNLNHASGTTAYDSSGNGNDGTLQNGAAFVVDNTLPPETDRLNLEGYTDDGGVLKPRDESDPTNDIDGNPLQYSGSVYPRRPEYRNSYAASFDGSNDRLDCSTNALARKGNVVEFKVKVDYQANQTTSIIASDHSSNNSTCYAPHLRLVHNTNQIIFYGCRGAPFPYWNIDSSFYGVWHTIKLRMHNTNATLIYLSIDGGDEVASDANITTSPGDWGHARNTYWAFGAGKNMELSDVKIFTTESDYNSNNPIIHHPLIEGSGTTAYDASGNGNHGTLVGGLPFTSSSDFPLINNTANRTGFTAGYKTSASSGRARWNAGTLPSFDVKKFKLKWYQPVEITSADTGGCLLCLNDGNGKFTLRTGSSSGLMSNETLTLNGTTSSRTYIQDTISVGWHTIEMEYDGNNNWSITFDGQLKSALTYSQSSFRTCNVAWIGPSQNGSNADANTIYSELKVWDDSDTLRIDLSLDEEVLIDRVSGESPDQTSSISSIAIPIDSSDPTQDVLGGDAQHLGISFTDYS